MNPCPVHDEFTGTVFLFFIAVLGHTSEAHQLITGKNVARLCYISSTDNGNTWSPVTDLTQTVIGETIKEWATFALGPGHGIQLKSGRLLIPAYAYFIECKECFGQLCQTTPRAFCFHSDTHGRTWRFGEAVPGPESVECQVVSVDEEGGTNILYCNARSPLGYRVQSVSMDDGAVFQDGQLVPRLVEPRNGCQGSVVGFPAPLHLYNSFSNDFSHHTHHHLKYWEHDCTDQTNVLNSQSSEATDSLLSIGPSNFLNPTWVVYCHPTWNTSRKDLGVFLSLFPRDPDSWCGPWVIYDGPSAYSDLAYMELSPSPEAPPAVAFACLFECGTSTAYDQICFSIFTLYELIDNIPHSIQQGPTSKNHKHKIGQFEDMSKRRKGKMRRMCTII